MHGWLFSREFKFSLFGKQRQFREFIALWYINLNTTYIKFNRYYDTVKSMKISTPQKLTSVQYRICGTFGSDYNLVVWRIWLRLPNLMYANTS